eukprot:10918887-Alexandrium_andersonii.AAC.1
MLAAAWSTVSSRRRPLRDTGCARIALEPRSLMTRTIKDASLPSLVRKQSSIPAAGTACSPGTALA